MKKILLILSLCLMTSVMSAQKIKKSEYDKFNKCKHIETSWVNVRKNVVDLKDVNVMLYAFNGHNFLRFKINNTEKVIPEGAVITLLDENGNTYDFTVYETAVPGQGKGATGFMASAKFGVDILSTGDLTALGNNLINAIRINTGDGYVDYDVKKDNAEKLKKAYQLFQKELDK